jgi:hypothetical protein
MKSPMLQIINKTIDQNDPTQKVIGLLAMMVDDKFSEMSEEMLRVNNRMNTQDTTIKDIEHLKVCPLGFGKNMEELNERLDSQEGDIKQIREILQPIDFVGKYPKMAILMLIGFLVLVGMGFDKLLSLI